MQTIHLESLFLLKFQQGKVDLPAAKLVVDEISKFFKGAFGINDTDIKVFEDATLDGCK